MKEKLAALKNYVTARKTKFLVSALAVTTTIAVLMRIGIKQHNEFLKENDLYDEYYNPNEE